MRVSCEGGDITCEGGDMTCDEVVRMRHVMEVICHVVMVM